MTIITCKCGAIIPDENIDWRNRCNEEGEEWAEVSGTCPACNKEYETTQWGEFQNDDDAKELLKDYIEELLKS